MTGPAAEHRRADIQGLRALAVIVVIAFHAGLPVPGGFVGVDVFFVISGFVITAMLMREWASSGRIAFGTFYLRRFRRLTPALALMVGVTMVAAAFLLEHFSQRKVAGPDDRRDVKAGADQVARSMGGTRHAVVQRVQQLAAAKARTRAGSQQYRHGKFFRRSHALDYNGQPPAAA